MTPQLEQEFESFWARYPKKASKGEARRAFRIARLKAPHMEIMAGVECYRRAKQYGERQYIQHPHRWLNGEGWLNEYPKD
jgi:Ni/Co efflux regulator RcnB